VARLGLDVTRRDDPAVRVKGARASREHHATGRSDCSVGIRDISVEAVDGEELAVHERQYARAMRLYVCWGLFRSPRPGGHPCRNAHEALRDAGWNPEVEKVYGLGILGDALNPTRRKVRKVSGQNMVPVLVTDEEEVISGSDKIAKWARDNPATASDRV
jgi:hypothetical protein